MRSNKKVPCEDRKAQRFEEWKGWINSFLDLNKVDGVREYQPIAYAAELLNDYYWRLVLNYIKPLLYFPDSKEEHYIHHYKIISASELTIMAVLPMAFVTPQRNSQDEDDKTRRLNAEFAFFVAIVILRNWKVGRKSIVTNAQLNKVICFREAIDVDDSGKMKKYHWDFVDEHIEWLKGIVVAGRLPILSNSQTWRMVTIAAMRS